MTVLQKELIVLGFFVFMFFVWPALVDWWRQQRRRPR